ncbi:MAG: hypothetical protein QOF91_2715 [Alphaproteobacteria bacterium]|jgi:hypothetical protein|nr:hypothetical protein [Alphaproteobacteria bacterium]
MRAKIANSDEPIWEGRLHLGDEPGIYGDASYSGVCCDFPVTLQRLDPRNTDPSEVSFHLKTDGVTIYNGYDGHLVTVFSYAETATPFKWTRQTLVQQRMTIDEIVIPLPEIGREKRYFSVRIEAAVDAAPGLYDDFVIRSLALTSSTHYADFGFR